jgi:hypothetical protein
MSREVDFCIDKQCDICGEVGAWDFYGDYICPDCWEKFKEDSDE